VPGVGASLIPGNDVKVLGEDIHHFALALIAPLNTHHHDIG
jgi:hypothetical protein